MTYEYKNKTAVVTGSSRGLGLGCVEELLQLGFRVIATARNPSKIKESLEKKNVPTSKLVTSQLEVNSEPSLESFSRFLNTEIGECHVLINNAGIYVDKADAAPLGTPAKYLVETLMTNLVGPYRLTQIVLPLMKKQNFGRIVNVSSGMGQISDMGTGYPAYRISKTALNGLTRLTSREAGSPNILVNSVCPGWVKTDMGGPQATRDLPEGVRSILWAALLPDKGPTGGFYRDGKELSW
jgi:NAD(P)-dependent dehydrogenase (short-subunit alcohol dehydrogenase family)